MRKFGNLKGGGEVGILCQRTEVNKREKATWATGVRGADMAGEDERRKFHGQGALAPT